MFRIAIIGWKAEEYIERCISSVISQDFKDWTACVIIDPSEDRTAEMAERLTKQDSRIKFIANKVRMFALPNFVQSIREQQPQDEDILVTLDADDWFAGPDTLSIVDSYYKRNPEILVTHGSWISYPNPSVPNINIPYTSAEWERGIRKGFHASHLRTFKYKVWKHVKDEDLRDSNGLYIQVAGDVAIMSPVLEMAGRDRVQFIPELIYVYNQETPYNCHKLKAEKQTQSAEYTINRTPYSYRDKF